MACIALVGNSAQHIKREIHLKLHVREEPDHYIMKKPEGNLLEYVAEIISVTLGVTTPNPRIVHRMKRSITK